MILHSFPMLKDQRVRVEGYSSRGQNGCCDLHLPAFGVFEFALHASALHAFAPHASAPHPLRGSQVHYPSYRQQYSLTTCSEEGHHGQKLHGQEPRGEVFLVPAPVRPARHAAARQPTARHPVAYHAAAHHVAATHEAGGQKSDKSQYRAAARPSTRPNITKPLSRRRKCATVQNRPFFVVVDVVCAW